MQDLHQSNPSPNRGILPDGQGVPPFSIEENAMRDIYQDVTDKIVAALAQGAAPWIKPWSSSGSVDIGHQPYPINAITRRPYSDINLPLLWAEARLQGFTQDRWLTFNQAKKTGGHIRMQVDEKYLPQLAALSRDTLKLGALELKSERSGFENVTTWLPAPWKSWPLPWGSRFICRSLNAGENLEGAGISARMDWVFAVAVANIFFSSWPATYK